MELFLLIFDSNYYVHKPSILEEIQRRGVFNVIDNRSGYKVDFVIRKNNAFRRLEFERRKRSNVLGFDAWIVSLEDLILSKIIWIQDFQSDKQINDIKSLLENPQLNNEYIRKWIKELNLNTFNLF